MLCDVCMYRFLDQISLRVIMNQKYQSDLIAIIGMGCRFPGANDHNQFWHNIEQGINSISEITSQRWEVEKYYSDTPETPNKTISK